MTERDYYFGADIKPSAEYFVAAEATERKVATMQGDGLARAKAAIAALDEIEDRIADLERNARTTGLTR